MRTKKIVTLALALLMAMGIFLTPVYADTLKGMDSNILPLSASDDNIVPLWDNIATIQPSLLSSGNTLYADVTVATESSSSSITGTMYLEEEISANDWDSVKSWSIQGTGYASRQGSYSGDSGSTYRVRVKVFVGGESATVYSDEVTL